MVMTKDINEKKLTAASLCKWLRQSITESDRAEMAVKIAKRVLQKKETVSYGDLCEDVGIPRTCVVKSFPYLDQINNGSSEIASVLLSVLVVRQGDKIPGDGFFKKAEYRWGNKFNPEKQSRREFFRAECQQVYDAVCRGKSK